MLDRSDEMQPIGWNVSHSSTVKTQSMSLTSLLLLPGKTSSAHLHGFRIERGAGCIDGSGSRMSMLQPRVHQNKQLEVAVGVIASQDVSRFWSTHWIHRGQIVMSGKKTGSIRKCKLTGTEDSREYWRNRTARHEHKNDLTKNTANKASITAGGD